MNIALEMIINKVHLLLMFLWNKTIISHKLSSESKNVIARVVDIKLADPFGIPHILKKRRDNDSSYRRGKIHSIRKFQPFLFVTFRPETSVIYIKK
jgi:hypothetical protein